MPRHDFLFDKVLLQCFAPAADRFAGGISSDVFSLQNYRLATFFVLTGAIEDANISNIVPVDPCDDTTPTATGARAFERRGRGLQLRDRQRGGERRVDDRCHGGRGGGGGGRVRVRPADDRGDGEQDHHGGGGRGSLPGPLPRFDPGAGADVTDNAAWAGEPA